MQTPSFYRCYFNSLSYCFNCFINPLLGSTIARFSLNIANASLTVILFAFKKYAITMVELLDTPALQWTNTFVVLMFSKINLWEESKKHLIFSDGSSPTRIRKCLIDSANFNYASPKTDTTAPILCLCRQLMLWANL